MSQIRLFTDLGAIPEGIPPCLLLIPFLGNHIGHNGYSAFEREGRDFLELATLERSEIGLLPFDGQHLISHNSTKADRRALDSAQRFVDRVASSGRKTLVLVNSDSDLPLPLDNVIVLRTSLNRRTRRPWEFALPAWHEDLVATHWKGELKVREKAERPVVGFCGQAAMRRPGLKRMIKIGARRVLRPFGVRIPHNDGVHLRREAMTRLRSSEQADCRFIVRSDYFGGALNDARARETARREYIQNLEESDYALCVRGYGNFSFRFFEALSMGRVPLLVDTDCVLPYDFAVDYPSFCVIVPDHRLGGIGASVARWHCGLSPQEFQGRQRLAREVWKTHLSPEGFFRRVAAHWRPEEQRL